MTLTEREERGEEQVSGTQCPTWGTLSGRCWDDHPRGEPQWAVEYEGLMWAGRGRKPA